MAARGAPTAERHAGGASTLRVFFALWPAPATRAAVAEIAHDVVGRAGGRATRVDSLHLTLAFVGDVAHGRIHALEAIGGAAARAVASFTLTLDRLGGFDDAGIAWIGTDAVPEDLSELVRRLNEGLAAQRFRVDKRPFAAHVTLARKCRRMSTATIAPIPWPIDRVSLVASELGAGGSRYRMLAEWRLGRPL